eukprot:417186-Pyramimonas_sp.AAC.1
MTVPAGAAPPRKLCCARAPAPRTRSTRVLSAPRGPGSTEHCTAPAALRDPMETSRAQIDS